MYYLFNREILGWECFQGTEGRRKPLAAPRPPTLLKAFATRICFYIKLHLYCIRATETVHIQISTLVILKLT